MGSNAKYAIIESSIAFEQNDLLPKIDLTYAYDLQ